MTSALEVFRGRTDLKQFGQVGLLLFALELRFGIDDITSVAATAVTDGNDDHKCDLMYIDSDSRTAVLAQAYIATNSGKASAPSNKAADLGIAAAWILGNEKPERLGTSLRAAAEDLHQALQAGEVDTLELWYSHNLPESKRSAEELERATRSYKALLAQHYPDRDVEVRFLEVGRDKIEDWYAGTRNPILVTDRITVPSEGWFREDGDGWEAYCTSVPASWLQELVLGYGERLFSANVRSYIPSRRSGANINYGIERTARENPGRFWAFNNGVTALVNDVEPNKTDSLRRTLSLSGIAIVNGAQTTGALGRVHPLLHEDAKVLIRFVKAHYSWLIDDIIRYNNLQNQIKPSDFRSRDRVQKRLRDEFASIPDSTYLGARRGGPADRARRPSNFISSDTAAQALAAFHQDPGVAYHDLRGIWEDDKIYARYFSDHTTASHIVFCYSLWRAVANTKVDLSMLEAASLTVDNKDAIDYFRIRGSLHLLVAAVANAAEIYLGKALPNTFALSFGRSVSPQTAAEHWMPLVEALLPFAPGQLGPVFSSGGLRRREAVVQGLSNFRSVVASIRKANSAVFQEFADQVVIA